MAGTGGTSSSSSFCPELLWELMAFLGAGSRELVAGTWLRGCVELVDDCWAKEKLPVEPTERPEV